MRPLDYANHAIKVCHSDKLNKTEKVQNHGRDFQFLEKNIYSVFSEFTEAQPVFEDFLTIF